MANINRNTLSTLLHAVPTREAPPAGFEARTSPAQKPIIPHPQPTSLASLADAGLHASMDLKPLKGLIPRRFELPPLTGAAAMADERRYREEEASRLTSPNPAANVMSALRGGFSPMQSVSRPIDAPFSQPQSQSRPSNLGLNVIMQESTRADHAPMILPHLQQSEPTARHHQNQGVVHNEVHSSFDRDVPPQSDRQEERPTKAGTYPGPRPEECEPAAPSRGMSIPPGNVSPGTPKSSSKKHKCPYCSTEFTRHHNLKSHLLTHSKEKPFLCSTCNSRFRRLHDLKRHAKLHTGERSHVCSKCSRRFARGDALARHNKGPGGCAGRRGSVGADDDYGDGGVEGDGGMEGVGYSRDEQESDQSLRETFENERVERASKRRRSEPHRRSIALQNDAHASSQRTGQASTYPGSAVVMAAPRSSFSMASGAASPQEGPRLLSPRGGTSYTSVHITAPPSTYAQGQMTESPRPLSPGHDMMRLAVGDALSSHQHGRSPSVSSMSHNPFHDRRRSSGMSHFASHATQLPPLTSMTGHGAFSPHLPPHISIKTCSGSAAPPPPHPHSTAQAAGVASNASSISSHHRSSGGSTRELFGGVGGAGTYSAAAAAAATAHEGSLRDGNMWEQMQLLEGRLQQMQEDLRAQEVQYKSTIARLQGEVDSLRSPKVPEQQQQQQGNGVAGQRH